MVFKTENKANDVPYLIHGIEHRFSLPHTVTLCFLPDFFHFNSLLIRELLNIVRQMQ
jgi:hypothetical protein